MRVFVIALVFLAAALFGFIKHVQMAEQLNQPPKPALVSAAPADAPTVEEQKTAATQIAGPPIEIVDEEPASFDDRPLTLAEQLDLQADWLQMLTDEDSATDDGLGLSDLPDPVPYGVPIDKRGELLVAEDEENTSIVQRWNPFSGETEAVLMLKGFDVLQGLISETGLFFLVRELSDTYMNVDNLVYIDESGIAVMSPLWSVRDDPHLVLLSNETVAIVGGRDIVDHQPLRTVELATVSRGRLEVEALRDFLGPPRSGYSVVALADGRLMILGGSTSTDAACRQNDCTNRTYILNPKTRLLETGPRMLKVRASATASLLADGSVLVAGGCETDKSGNTIRSNTSERFIPDENRFEVAARLPIAMAGHRAMHASADSSSPLLLIDTHSSSVLTYDLENEAFRVVGGYSSLMTFRLGPFSNESEHFFWVSGNDGSAWSRQDIHIGMHATGGGVLASRTVPLFRTASSFLPDENGDSALLVGGYVQGSGEPTAAVDRYSISTGLRATPSMPAPRADSRAFRLRNGAVVVAGGSGDHYVHDFHDGEARALPLHILSKDADSRIWHTVTVDHPPDTTYARWILEGVVAIFDGKTVEHLSFRFDEPRPPEIRKTTLPDLPAYRGNRNTPGSQVVAKGLADGRLIVAGGIVHEKRIAVMKGSPEDQQRYIGRGNLVTADTYEIYDPVRRRWTTSAPAAKRGGQVVIMDDGRVAALHIEDGPGGPGRGSPMMIEISQADGGGWTTLDAQWPPRIDANSARLVTRDNELFLSGPAAEDDAGQRILQWFDAESGQWTTVWTEEGTGPAGQQQDVLAIVDIDDKQHLVVPVAGL